MYASNRSKTMILLRLNVAKMSDKKKIKVKKRKGIGSNSEKEEDKNGSRQDQEKPFNYGGLPQRDIKKNLGCG